VAEWRLFDGPAPSFSTLPFFAAHPWVPPEHQAGHADRTAMAAGLIGKVIGWHHPATLSDLGCGDGALLAWIADLPVRAWGYDAGKMNVSVATFRGLDVREADILGPGLEYGELITCCEVLEHLADPHGFLRTLPGRLLVLTSPAAETGDWHYEHHAWAWDMPGYRAMVTGAGWDVQHSIRCDGGMNTFGGIRRAQSFQAVLAVKP